ncbi:transposase [Brucella abortus]|uniref:transposase n=1 Tax=Brucella abortus TaxID=235 RepID=UPI000CEEAE2B|nr:transposase [Brucella abortus]
MSRRSLTDEQWNRIEAYLPGRVGTPGRSGVDNRLFVDAILWMPGHYGDCPQASSLLSGLKGVGHVIADAAYDADHLRAFIASDLKATAQIKVNPTRSSAPTIDWRLYKERHQIECFFNKLKRYRRIALRCEKTLTAFVGFVHLACAMIWLR